MSFAAEQVTRLEAIMAANPGASTVTIDGQTVSFADLEKRWQFWKNEAAKAAGGRRRVSQIKLG